MTNTTIASATISQQVGALRAASGIVRRLGPSFSDVEASIDRRPRSARLIVAGLGQELEDSIDDLARRRLARSVSELRRLGYAVKAPKDVGSLTIRRRALADHIADVAETTAAKAAAARRIATDTGISPGAATAMQLRSKVKTLAISGAVAAQNAATMAIVRANSDLFGGVAAMVTLDSATTVEICRPRAGAAWDIRTKLPLPWSTSLERFPGRPPWHFNCRTVLAPVAIDEPQPEPRLQDFDFWRSLQDAAVENTVDGLLDLLTI